MTFPRAAIQVLSGSIGELGFYSQWRGFC